MDAEEIIDSDSDSVAGGQWSDREVTPQGSGNDTSDGDGSQASPIRPPPPPPLNIRNTKLFSSGQTKKAGKLKPKRLFNSPQKRKQKDGDGKMRKLTTKRQKFIVQQNRRLADTEGTWVQCCNSKCNKWRHLLDVQEPCSIPLKWQCNMNKDEKYNSCEKPECDYKDLEFFFVKHTVGCIVWAKLSGYPWWPAIVDDDPDSRDYFWTNGFSEVPTHYHVVFLDFNVTRAWVSNSCLRSFKKDHQIPKGIKNLRTDLKFKLEEAIRRAQQAITLSIPERLKKFSFVNTFRGTWPKTPESSTESDASSKCSSPNSSEVMSPQHTDKEEKNKGYESMITSREVADVSSHNQEIIAVTSDENPLKADDKTLCLEEHENEDDIMVIEEKLDGAATDLPNPGLKSQSVPESTPDKLQTLFVKPKKPVGKPKTKDEKSKSFTTDLTNVEQAIQSVIDSALQNEEIKGANVQQDENKKVKKSTIALSKSNADNTPKVSKKVANTDKQRSQKGSSKGNVVPAAKLKKQLQKVHTSNETVSSKLDKPENNMPKKVKPVFSVKKKSSASEVNNPDKLNKVTSDVDSSKGSAVETNVETKSSTQSKSDSQESGLKTNTQFVSSHEVKLLPVSQLTNSSMNSEEIVLTQDDPSDFEELSQLVFKMSPPSSEVCSLIEMEE